VLVMDQDERVRGNRLAMLGQINATFTRIADFRQLAV
jgi:glycyl-tRNA synthetase beta subunit